MSTLFWINFWLFLKVFHNLFSWTLFLFLCHFFAQNIILYANSLHTFKSNFDQKVINQNSRSLKILYVFLSKNAKKLLQILLYPFYLCLFLFYLCFPQLCLGFFSILSMFFLFYLCFSLIIPILFSVFVYAHFYISYGYQNHAYGKFNKFHILVNIPYSKWIKSRNILPI